MSPLGQIQVLTYRAAVWLFTLNNSELWGKAEVTAQWFLSYA